MVQEHRQRDVQMKAKLDTLTTKLKSYEKARVSMVTKNQHIVAEMRKLQKGGKAAKSTLGVHPHDDNKSAGNMQRELSKLRREHKKLSNELDVEHERNSNLQKKIKRVAAERDRHSGGGGSGDGNVAAQKLKRVEKERKRLDQECQAKTKKNEEMFLRLKKEERRCAKALENYSEAQAKMGAFNQQMKEVNRRAAELQTVTEERDKAWEDMEKVRVP